MSQLHPGRGSGAADPSGPGAADPSGPGAAHAGGLGAAHPSGRGRRLLLRTLPLAVATISACEARPAVVPPDEVEARAVDPVVPVCTAPTAPTAPTPLDTVVSGLETPWDVAFLPDGRALVTERAGRIRLLGTDGSLEPEPWARLPVYAPPGSEVGLMGIDVSPDGRAVYVAATFERSAGRGGVGRFLDRIERRLARSVDGDRGQPVVMRVLRYEVEAGRGQEPTVVVDGLASGYLHGGGALRFGPDGMLYLTNGDSADPWWAQDPASVRGKILRYAPDGSIPEDNPFRGSPVFALGVRHAQGLAWDSGTGALLATDHGPSGLETEDYRTDEDELNLVVPGANLGWPIVAGASEGGALRSPIREWKPALAPGGVAVLDGGPSRPQSVFVTGLRGASLRRLELVSSGVATVVSCEDTLLQNALGRLRLARAAPDGSLWVGTSNRDGRGLPREGDDHIVRIRPPGS